MRSHWQTAKRAIMVFCFLFSLLTPAGCGPDVDESTMRTDHIESTYDGVPCNVYFFTSWSTYSHPVRPQDPLDLEDALNREGYYRAWMVGESGKELFVFFEAVSNNRQETQIAPEEEQSDLAVGFVMWRAQYDGGTLTKGPRISYGDALRENAFLVQQTGSGKNLNLITQTVQLSYRYIYQPDGTLKKIIITNPDGKVSELDY